MGFDIKVVEEWRVEIIIHKKKGNNAYLHRAYVIFQKQYVT